MKRSLIAFVGCLTVGSLWALLGYCLLAVQP